MISGKKKIPEQAYSSEFRTIMLKLAAD